MIHYIIQVLLFQTLFLAVYDLFLKKETFFQWNRAYLIITSVLAYIIPFISMERLNTYVNHEMALEIPAILFTDNTNYLNEIIIGKVNSSFQFSTLEIIYLVGIVLTTLLFVSKIIQIINKINTNKNIDKKEYKLVLLSKEVTAFSFFKYLFLGKEIYKQEHQHIIDHELIHIKQKHSIDLLFFELQKIIFWINPFSYLYQNRISALHEFIADEKVIKTNPKKQFFENLLNQTFQIEKFSFVNQFYKKSLIKKRIIMATKNKSKAIFKLKYLLVVPIIMLMLVYTSCTKTEELTPEQIEVHEKQKVETIPFSVIENVPVYPGCAGNQDELRKCMSTKIATYVTKNFNVDLAQDLGLKPGKKRISVQFKIDESGFITDIKARAPHPKLQAEAIRLIKLLPEMKPGLHNEKAVSVRYNLPIIFKIEGNEVDDELDTKLVSNENIGMINGLINNIVFDNKNLENSVIESRNAEKINDVVSFKLKVPGKPTLSIKGNKLTKEALNKIKKSRVGDVMIIFDIKIKNSNEKTTSLEFSIDNSNKQTNLEGTIYGDFGYLKMTKSRLISGIIGALDYDRNTHYKVERFQILINQKTFKVEGNRMTDAINTLINKLETGDRIKINHIESVDSNGKTILSVEPITIKIK